MKELYIGLISGTSADGIDAVLLEVTEDALQVLHSLYVPYPSALRQTILELARAPVINLDALGQTDAVLGQSFANAALAVIEAAGISPKDVRAIGCHGQTIRHAPAANQPFTMQIGDPNQIAGRTGITTVADFRRKDMALGGQGAPLVPAFHKAAFGAANETRVVVNLGGIANLTVISAGRVVAGFDTGPANCLLDQHIDREQGKAYDAGGEWSAAGQPDSILLERLLKDPFFAAEPPKSTGPEYFNLDWLAAHQRAAGTSVSGSALQATLCELSAQSIATAMLGQSPDARLVLLCGGGAHNADLARRLSKCLPGVQLSGTDLLGIDPDFVEGAAFAWLACQTVNGRSGNVPEATGATAATILGAIYRA